ncbi:unnamed protein product [Boreogadus saida]
MDEEREDGGPTSKTTLSGENGKPEGKAKSPEQQQRADSPGPSRVSMKSDRSLGHPPDLKDGRPSREERRRQERADSPGPSCVSMKSDWSMDNPPDLKNGRPSREESPEQQERADSPGPSCVSMKSDPSMHKPPELKDGRPSREERPRQKPVQKPQTELIRGKPGDYELRKR